MKNEHAVSIIESITINEWPHVLMIYGENINNPILLYLHGGPGQGVTSIYVREKIKKLEKLFTICYFDQKGLGKSYSLNIPEKTMTLEQLVEDAQAVTNHLVKKFKQPKIFVIGHSWGTMLGSFLVNKYPESYNAYIGIGQMANQIQSESLSLQFILREAERRNDIKAVEKISKLKVPNFEDAMETWWDYIMSERGFVIKYGGILYKKDIEEMDTLIQQSTEYTEQEKQNYFGGIDAKFSIMLLWKTMIEKNSIKNLKKQAIPIFIMQGIHDYATAFLPAKEYFEALEAPFKKFYAFDESAHLPHVEEYEKFESIIRDDILQYRHP